jgi:hypothetical protein
MKITSSHFRMKKSIRLIILLTLFTICISHAQSSINWNLGVGGGISYGGFGARITYLPIDKLGIFGAMGYNMNSLGYNVGAQFHFPSEKKISAYLTAMYGYNAVLIVDAIETESKTTYYGPTAGAGMQIRFKGKSFLSVELLMPFRPQTYQNAVDDLKELGYEIKDPLPVAFGIGYHFKF